MNQGISLLAGAAYDEYKRIRSETKKEITFLQRAMRTTTDPELKKIIAQEIEEVKASAEEKLRGMDYSLY